METIKYLDYKLLMIISDHNVLLDKCLLTAKTKSSEEYIAELRHINQQTIDKILSLLN